MSYYSPIPRPLIPYPGSKTRLAPWILKHFVPHRTFCDAFGGSGAVVLNKRPSAIDIFNDTDDEICNLFEVVRDERKFFALHRLLKLTPYHQSEFRKSFNHTTNQIEKARRTIVRYSMALTPVDASIRKRSATFSASSYEYCNLPDAWTRYIDVLPIIHNRLMHLQIQNLDWFDLATMHDRADTLTYLDSPYYGAARSANKRMYKHDRLSLKEQIDIIKKANTLKSYVLFSCYSDSHYDKLLMSLGWVCKKFTTRTNFSGKNIECLWLNPRLASAQCQTSLF